MRVVNKAESKKLLQKAVELRDIANEAYKHKKYNAAVTNYTIAVINYLDALSVNLFGKDLSSDHHEASPRNLKARLNQKGITDFKKLCDECAEVLKFKNLSYSSKEPTEKEAKESKRVTETLHKYVDDKWDSSV